MTPRLLSLALGVALLASGCAARPVGAPPVASLPAPPAPTPPAPPPVPTSPPETRATRLAAAIDAALNAPEFGHATVGAVVQSLTTGETLYRRNGQAWLTPASTTKVLTTIAAAERLGWGFRFETRLVAMGPIKNGVLDGDLLVVGTGDPTINPRHPSRANAFDEWARTLKAQGLRRVAGHVIGDDSAMDGPGWGVGWAWDDLVEDYGAAFGALQYNENVVRITMGPGITPGAPPVVYLSPSNHGMLVDVTAVTSAENTTPALIVSREPGSRILEIRGRAPLGHEPVSTTVAAANPTIFYTGELRLALQRAGIVVDGAGIDIDEETDRPRASDGTVLLVDQSAPVSEIAREMLAWSINLYAESLLAAMDTTAPVTFDDGLAAMRDTLSTLAVPGGGYHLRDASGLSRNDYVAAETLVAAIAGAWTRPGFKDTFLAVMPRSGRQGAMERRLVGTPAEGRVYAKSGSMSNVRGLTGVVQTADGEFVAFAFLANGFAARGADIDARVDACLQAIAALPPS